MKVWAHTHTQRMYIRRLEKWSLRRLKLLSLTHHHKHNQLIIVHSPMNYEQYVSGLHWLETGSGSNVVGDRLNPTKKKQTKTYV